MSMNLKDLRRHSIKLLAIAVLPAAIACMTAIPASASSGPVLEAWGGDNGLSLNGPDPVLSPSLPAGVTVTQISSDVATYFAVTSTGTLYAWGDNSCGQLGDGTYTYRSTPAAVVFPSGVAITQVSAGDGNVIALDQTGTAWLWGCNSGNLVLGIPSEPDREPTPTALAGIPSGVQLTDVAIGQTAAMAVGSDGNVYAWGNNGQGQFGYTGHGSFTPQVVGLPAGVVATSVATDGASGEAVTSTGALYTWGYNAHGECGCGTNGGVVAPTLVSFPGGVTIASVSAGNQWVIARDTSGNVWSFGYNGYGQLGDGNGTDSDVAVQVQLPAGVSAAAIATNATSVHGLAVSTTGDLYAWGSNAAGQLGNSNGSSSDLPVSVDLGAGVTVSEIATSNGLSFVLAQRASQSVSFTTSAPSAAQIGGPSYAVDATATSGLPVTLSIDSASTSGCSLSGSTVSFSAPVGTCIVDADQTGNTGFEPATQAQQSFAVGPASQSIAFTSSAPSNATFGGTYTAAATATSALPVTLSIDPSASSVCSISGSSVSFIGVGTCVIDGDQGGDTDYQPATQAQQSFSVGQASQSLSFTSVPPSPASYQGPSYTVSATATSGLTPVFSVDPMATSVCSVAGATVSFSGVGTCIVDANQTGDTDYQAAPQVSQSFTVVRGAPSAPAISNLPGPAYLGGGFTAAVSTTGDGARSVTSATPSVCTASGLVVSYVGVGSCTLTAHVAQGTNYVAADGSAQTFSVLGFTITTTSLPNATPGVAYGPVALQEAGAATSTSPYATTIKWKKITLPKGLRLSSAGGLSGTPSAKLAAGPSSVSVQVTETVTTLNGRKKVKTETTVQATIPLTLT